MRADHPVLSNNGRARWDVFSDECARPDLRPIANGNRPKENRSCSYVDTIPDNRSTVLDWLFLIRADRNSVKYRAPVSNFRMFGDDDVKRVGKPERRPDVSLAAISEIGVEDNRDNFVDQSPNSRARTRFAISMQIDSRYFVISV